MNYGKKCVVTEIIVLTVNFTRERLKNLLIKEKVKFY